MVVQDYRGNKLSIFDGLVVHKSVIIVDILQKKTDLIKKHLNVLNADMKVTQILKHR